MFLAISQRAVSYTHLDVYKRQIVSSSELQIDVVQSADVLEAGTSSSRPQESESDSSEKETTEAETETPAQTREESSAG